MNIKIKEMTIKIKERKSPLWNLWRLLFPGADMDTVYIEFADTIWTPNGAGVPDFIVEHEKVHFEQQRGSYFWATIWLIKYVFSKKFRYSQELPAYKHQLLYMVQKNLTKGGRIVLYNNLKPMIAATLSHKTYGPMVSYEKAMEDLTLDETQLQV